MDLFFFQYNLVGEINKKSHKKLELYVNTIIKKQSDDGKLSLNKFLDVYVFIRNLFIFIFFAFQMWKR